MNKVYRVVRNSVTGLWVVASELAKGQTKSSGRALLMSSAFIASVFGADAMAETVAPYNPYDNDRQAGALVVSNGDSKTLSGPVSFQKGTDARAIKTLGQLEAEGAIISGTVGDKIRLDLGATTGVSVADKATGANVVVAVYDNNKMFSDRWADRTVSVYQNVGDGQYIDARLGTVNATGGQLTIDIGDSKSVAGNNTINIFAKDTSLGYADGSGESASSVTWASRNAFNFGSFQAAPTSGTGTFSSNSTSFKNSITAFDGSVHVIGNLDGLKSYNTWLVSQLKSGALAASEYDKQFKLAINSATEVATYRSTGVYDPADESFIPYGPNAVLAGVGKNATVTLASTGQINVIGYGLNTGTGAALRADQGASAINDGKLNSEGGATAMYATNGGKAINNGVLSAGFSYDNTPLDTTRNQNYSDGYGIIADKGAAVVNTGIINVAAYAVPTYTSETFAIRLADDGTKGSNSGVINVGVNSNASTSTSIASGVKLDAAGAAFTNETAGLIYLGRAAQYDVATAKTEVGTQVSNAAPLVGIKISGKSNAENKGTITIGEKVQNSDAIQVTYSGTASRTVTNSGTININGAANAAPLANVGIRARDTDNSAITNSGTINVNGVNGIGLKAERVNNSAATITNTGTINVNGSTDPASGTRNYGAWADGKGAKIKIAGGGVNLAGDSAIGVRADNNGNITVSGGSVNFLAGKQQVGFFAYGAGSSVDINNAPAAGLNVSTEGSTLFRVEDGAKVNNNAAAKLIASGKGSTALQVTGVGTSANLDSLDITVTGEGATALKVEGGATGQMSGAAKLTLKDGATAVVIDDNKYDLSGNKVGKGESIFTNLSNIVVDAARDVTAFVVKNGGELINAGDIHLSHGTAIEVVGAGSTVTADASGKRGSITVDDGKAGIYVHGGATLNTADTITVDNGASGVLVGDDAGRVVIQQGAHITGKGSSFGNLVTNQSAAGNVLVDGATLEMQGSGAALLSESNLDAASHGHVIVSSQVGGKGIALSQADGSQTAGSLELGPNWQIDVTGNGSGVFANTTGDLSLAGSQISISGAGVGVQADAAGTVHVAQGTQISAVNADAVLVAGNPTSLINEGQLQAASAEATAIRLGAGNSAFVNRNGGQITGNVELGDGNDSALLEDSVLNGSLLGGAGDDLITVRGNNVSHGVLDGGLGGFDILTFDGHDYTADASNVDQLRNFEQFDLNNGSRLDLQRDLLLGDNGNGQGTLNIDPTSTLAMTRGSFGVKGNLSNAGLITLSNGQPGNILTVDGDYTGNGGTLELDTELGDDASPTDKLVVKGNTAGSSLVKINATADTGAYTQQDGIEVVSVGGQSDGAFALSGRVVAGAREYLLVKGGKADPANGNWYLRSEAPVQPQPEPQPEPAVDPQPEPQPEPVVDPQPQAEPQPVPAVDPQPQREPQSEPVVDPQPAAKPAVEPTPVYRPEIGAYLGNELAALSMFQHTLHDRLGEVDFTERQRADGNGKDHQAVWTRVVGRGFDSATGANQVHSTTRTQMMQIGAELGQWTDGDSRTHFGVMAGAGQADTNVSSKVINAKSKGKVDGYSVGAYATWFADASKPTGLYVDSWLQYGWYDNTVRGDSLSDEHYKSRSLTGSVETGYAFELGQSGKNAWYIEPEAQVIVSRYDADKHVEANGTEVKVQGGSNVTTRLGARAFTRPLDASQKRLQPFVETNWWHNGKAQAMSFSGESQSANLASDVYELKVGAQAELAKGWTAWGHVGQQAASGGQGQTEAQLGIKYSW